MRPILSSFLLRSEWSQPSPALPERAAIHHLVRYTRWLLQAGAEPRLALVLMSSPKMKQHFVDEVAARGVEVRVVSSTAEEPLPNMIRVHEAGHFNRRLFLLDGFEATDPAPLFKALEEQRGQLKRSATWVTICVESLSALITLNQMAPKLVDSFMVRCLLLGEGINQAPATSVPGVILDGWLRERRQAELIYADALSPQRAPNYSEFSRLIRSGYAALLQDGAHLNPTRRALLATWRGEAVSDDSDTALEAAYRHADGAALGSTLVHLLAGKQVLPPLLANFQRIRGMADGDEVDPTVIDALRAGAAADGVDPNLRVEIELGIGAAWAAHGDLTQCGIALANGFKLSKDPRVALELAFLAAEKRIQIETFRNVRGTAQKGLDRLETLAPWLESPFYMARAKLARAEFSAPLDAGRAKLDAASAASDFTAHGYPDWAAIAGGLTE